ncbi:MAG: hypothetical protein J5995_04795 [Muribaculaceae bacterium]|nr:hypothetical protein [Muribaculaceae bacterium]
MKKKITKEDLDLNIEIVKNSQSSPRMTETRTCGYDCDTTNPTLPDCKTIPEAGCPKTHTCWTIEPDCETRVGCVDSNSHAVQCCPITNVNTCKDTVDNCVSNATCGANTVQICMVTKNLCEHITQEDPCRPPIITEQGICYATNVNQECDKTPE